MNDKELHKLLTSAPVRGPAPNFWEQFPGRVTSQLRWQSQSGSVSHEKTHFHGLAWALGGAVCLLVAIAVVSLNRPASPIDHSMAQVEKCFQEIEAMFPNQVRAVVLDERGARMVLADTADVPKSTPLYMKICGPAGCQRVVTFSGQQITVNGESCDVLVDSAGHILLVGTRFAWSSASAKSRPGQYRIEAHSLEAS